MKKLLSVLIVTLALLAAPTYASMRVFNGSGTQLGTFTDLKLAGGLTVSQVSGKAQVATTGYGYLQTQTAVSGDLSASDCGKTITSDGSELYNLPALSSSTLGCRFTFIVGVALPLTVNPNGTNRIHLLTNAAGDAIEADAIGESVVLEAIAPGWAPVGAEKGTWSDVN